MVSIHAVLLWAQISLTMQILHGVVSGANSFRSAGRTHHRRRLEALLAVEAAVRLVMALAWAWICKLAPMNPVIHAVDGKLGMMMPNDLSLPERFRSSTRF